MLGTGLLLQHLGHRVEGSRRAGGLQAAPQVFVAPMFVAADVLRAFGRDTKTSRFRRSIAS
jgi:uncharacterized membrane protein YGL010W